MILHNQTPDPVEAALVIQSFKREKGPGIQYYLGIGKYISELASEIASTKERGLYLKEFAPEIAQLPPYLRSDCRWLYEELQRDPHQILTTLGISNWDEPPSSHPSVIRRMVREAAKRAH